MREHERAALVEELAKVFRFRRNDMRPDIRHRVLPIIERFLDAARADERKRIREALLAPDILEPLHRKLTDGFEWDDSVFPIPDPDEYAYEFLPYGVLEHELQAALAAIGLTEEGGAS